jgi:hypothetical protein
MRNYKFKMLGCAFRKTALIGFSAMALLTFAIPAQAIPNFVLNGNFDLVVNGAGGMGEFDNATYSTVTDWTSSGYNFIFAPGTADTTGGNGTFGNIKLWGPGTGSANGLTATSPSGGNYVAADGAFEVGAISQTIVGLTPGQNYILSFYWAAAQQSGYTGNTTEQWQVSLGGQTQTTAVLPNVSHGFSGWFQQTFTYTATNASEVLSFLAIGTPNGVPPFALLDGVSLTAATPEPGSLALMLSGLGLIGLGAIRSKGRFTNWLRVKRDR